MAAGESRATPSCRRGRKLWGSPHCSWGSHPWGPQRKRGVIWEQILHSLSSSLPRSHLGVGKTSPGLRAREEQRFPPTWMRNDTDTRTPHTLRTSSAWRGITPHPTLASSWVNNCFCAHRHPGARGKETETLLVSLPQDIASALDTKHTSLWCCQGEIMGGSTCTHLDLSLNTLNPPATDYCGY